MDGVPLQQFHLHRGFALLLAVVGLGAAAVAWAQVVQTISDAKPPTSTMQATSIVWSDRVFQSPAELAGWLRSRGATYASWATQHPVESALLERRPARTGRLHPAARRSNAAGATRSAATQSPLDASPSSGGSPVERIFIALLALLAAACAWTASLPRVLRNRFPDLARSIAPYRSVLLAGAAALMIGIVAGAALN